MKENKCKDNKGIGKRIAVIAVAVAILFGFIIMPLIG